jgi:predicted transcriptional regulator
MATKKVTITIPEETVGRLAALAAQDGVPLSGLVTSAAEDYLRRRLGLAAIEEWIAENGEFTPDEIAHVDALVAATEAAYLRRLGESGQSVA